jgi:predicted ester cyclase
MRTAIVVMALSTMPLVALSEAVDVEARNQEVIRKNLENINRGDASAAAGDFAEDAKNFGRPVGREGIQRTLEDIFATFPDWRMDVVEIMAHGDAVVVRCMVSGTHRGVGKRPVNGGMLVGVQPTGKRFEVSHIHWYTLRGGKIVEHYANRDDLGMMRQLGLLTQIPAASTQ